MDSIFSGVEGNTWYNGGHWEATRISLKAFLSIENDY